MDMWHVQYASAAFQIVAAENKKMTPLGLSRSQAAEYIGVGLTKFDELVRTGQMPKPKKIGSRTLYDRRLLEASFDELDSDDVNPWDEIKRA
jgi:hypothetical protein